MAEDRRLAAEKAADEPDEPQLRALGSYLHDFYCGVERIFERITVWLGPGVPKLEEFWAKVSSS